MKILVFTVLAKKVCPRLCDSASHWGEFTQPRTHFFGHLCIQINVRIVDPVFLTGLQHTELQDGAQEREPQLQRPPPLRRRRHWRHQPQQPPHFRARFDHELSVFPDEL